MRTRLTVILIALILGFCSTSCNGNSSIIGEWDFTLNGETRTVEFRNDGVYTITNEDGIIENEIAYEIDGNKIITTDEINTFSISRNKLTLTSTDGESLVLLKKASSQK